MSTLHERLLAATEPLHNPHASPPQRRVLAARDRALRALVELHAPEFFGGHMACLACSPGMPPQILIEAPCPTITAIAEALGVPTGDPAT